MATALAMGDSLHLQQVINFRDVGKTVNAFLGQKRVREGVFYRSARPDEATREDRATIKDELGVKTVIDLRTKTELLKQAQKREAQLAALAPLKSSAAMAEPLHIDGIDYHEIKITGRPFERFLMSQLTCKFIFLFILGYRMPAIRLLSRDVMLPRGLLGMGLATLDQSGDDIRQVLSLYTSAHSLPSVVHCTQGKDRTGLVCALVLMILSVPVPAIEHDYFLTDAALVTERQDRLAEIRELGLTDDWGDTARNMITGVAEHLEAKYGGLEGYLDSIGFGDVQRAQVREALLY